MHSCRHLAHGTSLSTVGTGRGSDILGDRVGSSGVLDDRAEPSPLEHCCMHTGSTL